MGGHATLVSEPEQRGPLAGGALQTTSQPSCSGFVFYLTGTEEPSAATSTPDFPDERPEIALTRKSLPVLISATNYALSGRFVFPAPDHHAETIVLSEAGNVVTDGDYLIDRLAGGACHSRWRLVGGQPAANTRHVNSVAGTFACPGERCHDTNIFFAVLH